MIEGGATILQKFKVVNEKWSGELQPMLHEVIPCLLDLQGYCKEFAKGKTSKGKGVMFAREFVRTLELRFPGFGSENEAFSIANLLSPRYHGIQLTDLWRFEDTKRIVIDQGQELLATMNERDTSSSESSSDSGESALTASEKLLRKARKSLSQVTEQLSMTEKELMKFLDLPKIHFRATGDEVLSWWREHSGSFPVLAKIVKKYFRIPASSAPSEIIFSASGNIATAN